MQCFLIDELNIKESVYDQFLDKHDRKSSNNYNYEAIKIFSDNNTIDGDKLQEYFFGTEKKYDVFISHFSQEKDKAIQLKNFLKEKCKVNAFVDSYVWGNYREILRYIKKELKADNEEYLLANLHIMIQSSLRNIIESARYFIFIDNKEHCNNNTIYSPWVYYELQEANRKHSDEINLSMENLCESLYMSIKRDIRPFLKFFKTVNDISDFKSLIK
ncbi:hypothetical protein SLK76_000251 [Campylobacter jejuni]|nr:hypothetical protein [Campylobacter jejuni]EHT4619676.1 hypothetical protein [Campylobacter jejuni]EIG9797324.1 hypothetical protein [Campylobacter jejuni]EIR9493048.1 hypothetical protein [Campylobacter jejuni]EIS8238828.1 hypothetical protein [Campylobacter jejuni]